VIVLDHLFLLVRPWRSGQLDREAADELAESLEATGFRRGAGRRHPGQGTENRCFRFERFMLELLFVVSREEAGSDRSAPLALLARRDDAAASPFGFASRSIDASRPEPPYPHTPYCPVYLPAGARIALARGVPLGEPLWFHLPFFMPGDGESEIASRASLATGAAHPNGLRRLDTVTLSSLGPLGVRSAEIAERLGIVRDDGGARHRLTLAFDGGRRGRRIEPHAELPLTIDC